MNYTVHSFKPLDKLKHDHVIDVTFEPDLLERLFIYPKGRLKFVGSGTVWHYMDGPYKNSRCSTSIEMVLYDIYKAGKRGLL
jgi:hypothetical protein